MVRHRAPTVGDVTWCGSHGPVGQDVRVESLTRWPRPADDGARVAALHQLNVLDRPEDSDLEAVVRVAAYVCGVPAAAVNLIDEDRQWQAATYGVERGEVSRDESMCGWSILSQDVTYTPDASQDEIFADNPFVTGRLGRVRLYASAPVVVDTGYVVGTVCAFDSEPGTLSAVQIDRLRDLAKAAARILELRRSLDHVTQAAAKDPLTGLFNRSIFEEAVRRAVDLFARGVSRPGVLFVDLDEFKPVNDRHGHHAGDAVLRAAAGRLRDGLRATDVAARLGGDEFAVLVQDAIDVPLEGRLRRLASRLQTTMNAPVVLADGTEVSVRASVGSAVLEDAETSAETLIARADAAMYRHKAMGRTDEPRS